MSNYVPAGICKVQLDPVCEDGTPDATRSAIVACNVLNIDINTRLTDGFSIEDPSGIPGQNCIELELPGTQRPPEIVVDTCNVLDPEFDAVASGLNEIVALASGGVATQAAKKAEDCLCACEEGEEPCNRWTMTIWSLNYCSGASGKRNTDGRFYVTVFPNIEFQPQAGTVSLTNELGGSRQYLAYGYESSVGWRGPADIIPAEVDFTACSVSFPSDVCPPGDCGCGGCDSEESVPLAATARRRRTATPAAPAADIPDASELIPA